MVALTDDNGINALENDPQLVAWLELGDRAARRRLCDVLEELEAVRPRPKLTLIAGDTSSD